MLAIFNIIFLFVFLYLIVCIKYSWISCIDFRSVRFFKSPKELKKYSYIQLTEHWDLINYGENFVRDVPIDYDWSIEEYKKGVVN